MLSKVLWYLENGVTAIRTHTKFVFILVLIFIFPLLFFFTVENINQTTIENVKTVQKESVAILHRSLHTNSGQAIENAVVSEFNTPVLVQYYERTQAGTFDLVSGSEEAEPAVSSQIIQSTPEDGMAYIYEQDSATGRVWYAVSKSVTATGSAAYVSVHEYAAIDSIISSRIADLYWLLLFGLLFLFLVAYWLIKQVDWEARYREVQTSLQEQELLVGTITHEFRAPLTAIAGYLSFLFESNRLRNRDKEALENIGASTNRMLHLVNDFLEVAKIQSGKLDLKTEKISITEAVYRVISELGQTAAAKQLILRDATQNKDITLTTDKKRLQQILTNIVSNAVKYTDKGSVVVTYDVNPLYLTIRIQDTGSGISAEDREKLFQPFSRVGGVEKTDIVGSGLGMWITKKLVETLGGKISVESISGVGTHVVLKFDLRKIAAKTRDGIL